MKKINFLFFIVFSGIIFLCFAGGASAYTVEDLHLETIGTITIGPGKTEILLSPGDTYNLEVTAANQSGMTKIIKFTAEDIAASIDPNATIDFLGNKKGPYSLKDYVIPEATELSLPTGQRVRMPVTITIPEDISPGGLYGAIMIAAENLPSEIPVEPDKAAAQVNIITRVGSLLFIRIKGDVLESGFLKEFKADKNIYEAGPVSFNIIFENTGNVYLSPYGAIDIKDIFGRNIDQREVEPWFVLPKSDRAREIKWNNNFLFGKYTATLTLHRGYMNAGDVVDTKSFDFWVIPWKIIGAGLLGLILIIWFFVWIFSHIQWRKKPSKSDFQQPTQSFSPPPSAPNIPGQNYQSPVDKKDITGK